MAFKGGTSLSKVYQAIGRFSEDIDVTIDYRSLVDNVPDLTSLTSNSQRKKLSETLKAALLRHIMDELVPELQNALIKTFSGLEVNISVNEDAEKLWVYYPSAVENTDNYLRPSILIEFGGRNTTLPQDTLDIAPDVTPLVPGVRFPTAQVCVLSPLRTFWEKATLIHVECHRPELRPNAERLSRHWYDMARLADHDVGKQAMYNRELLRDVLSIKETFYRSRASHYDRCLSGQLRLVPEAPLLDSLRRDYRTMLGAQMLYGDIPSFDDIIWRLATLQDDINIHNTNICKALQRSFKS